LSTKTVAVVGKGVPAVTQAACTKMIHVAAMAGRGGAGRGGAGRDGTGRGALYM
jgi:hypothetical protein